MKLYLVQHGAAKFKEEDPKRSLTKQSRLDAASTGRFLGADLVPSGRRRLPGAERERRLEAVVYGPPPPAGVGV